MGPSADAPQVLPQIWGWWFGRVLKFKKKKRLDKFFFFRICYSVDDGQTRTLIATMWRVFYQPHRIFL